MNTYRAAKILGCSPQRVRSMISNGTMDAKKVLVGSDYRDRPKYQYDISEEEVERVKGLPIKARGVPRGSKSSRRKNY